MQGAAQYKALITAILAVAGLIAIGLAVWYSSGLSNTEITVALVCLMLGLAQLFGHFSRQRDREETRRELDDLATASTSVARDVQEMQTRIDDLEGSIGKTISKQNKKLVAQLRELETLVKEASETQTRPDKAAPGEVISGGGDRHDNSPANPASEHVAPDNAVTIDHPDERLVDLARQAISGNKIEFRLQPIVTLPQRKTRFYEEVTYLRGDGGKLIPPEVYGPHIEKAGLMPALNSISLFRAAQVLRQLRQRNQAISVFCNLTVSALSDSEFFPQFLDFIDGNKDIVDAMILEFAQPLIAAAGPLEQESLKALTARGFAFSLDQVYDLAIDYRELGDHNFRFLKLDADILLNRIEQANSPIQGEDLHALLKRFGIDLIINGIGSERVVTDVLDYEIVLGQGALFSQPRPVTGELTGQAGATAPSSRREPVSATA